MARQRGTWPRRAGRHARAWRLVVGAIVLLWMATLAAPASAQRRPVVEIEKSSSPATFVYAGQVVSFTVTVLNQGDDPLRDVVIRETFDPAELTYEATIDRADGPRISSSASGRTSISWSLPELRAGEPVSRTWRATVSDEAFVRSGFDVTTKVLAAGEEVAFHMQTLRPAFSIEVRQSAPERVQGDDPATRVMRTVRWQSKAPMANFRVTEELRPETDAIEDALGDAIVLEPCEAHAKVSDEDIEHFIGSVEEGKSGEACHVITVFDWLNAGRLELPVVTIVEYGAAPGGAERRGTITFATPALGIDLVELRRLDGSALGPGAEVAPGDNLRAAVVVVNRAGEGVAPSTAELTVSLQRKAAERDIRNYLIDGDPDLSARSQTQEVAWTLDGTLAPGERRVFSYDFTVSEEIKLEASEERLVAVSAGTKPIPVSGALAFAVVPEQVDRPVEWAKVAGFVIAVFLIAGLLPRFLRIPSRREAAGAPLPAPDAGPPDTDDEPAGLALSGGGYRAGAFALGVMLYLVDSGHHARIRQVSSVSGGSITSAYVGSHTGFGRPGLDPADFRREIRPLGRLFAAESIIKVDARFALVLAAFASLILAAGYLDLFATLPRGTVVALALLVGGLYAMYQTMSHAAYARLSALLGEAKLDQLRSGGALHVVCATELDSGKHMYFAPTFVFHEDHSPRMLVKDFPLARAVQASAAFPGVFPAVWVRPKDDFDVAKNRPRVDSMRLADGGVHDNLGVTWLTKCEDLLANKAHRLPRYAIPARQIVVNAGAPAVKNLRLIERLPVLFDARNFGRAMEVLHQSNSAARATDRKKAYLLDADGNRPGTVISLRDNPYGLALNLRNDPIDKWPDLYRTAADEGFETAIRARAGKLLGLLKAWDRMPEESDWVSIAETKSPGVRTHLKALRDAEAWTLVVHGYAVAMAKTYLDLGWGPPDRLAGYDHFVEVVTGRPASVVRAAGSAGAETEAVPA